MFTGLVTAIGDVVDVAPSAGGHTLTIGSPWADLALGESIALDGVCLTVTGAKDGRFTVEAVPATLDRTTVGTWRTGTRVNLERALRASDRLGGHMMQGHVDGVAEISGVREVGNEVLLDISLWDGAEGLVVPQGSVAIDGVSLTVQSMPAARAVTIALIPHTRSHTTLGARRRGDKVNVELDVVGKYVRQLLAPWSATADAGR